MNLRLIRHAESTANAENRWQGRVDSPLSDSGRLQASRLRSRFTREGYAPTRMYTSPLARAMETASIVSSGWACPIERWEDLAEVDVGVFSGLSMWEAEERFPRAAREFAATRDFGVVQGGETHDERTARAQRVVERLLHGHANADRVLVFSHGGILTHVIARLLGTDRLWHLGIQHTAIFEFSLDVDRWHLDDQSRLNISLWRIDRFNDASHLRERQG